MPPQDRQPGPRGSQSDAGNKVKIYRPIAASTTLTSPWGPRGGRNHNGIDLGCSVGSKCVAPCDGKIVLAVASGFGNEGGMIHFQFETKVGPIPAGAIIGWGHAVNARFSAGQKVRGGQVVGESNYNSAPHVHFIYQPTPSGDWDGTADPAAVYKFLDTNGEAEIEDPGDVAGGGGAGSLTEEDIFAIGRAAAISTNLELPGLLNMQAAMQLKGDKSIYNDTPLLPFIQQLTDASLRQFQSLPNGTFFAFYPDYFGTYNHRKPYWDIDDIEIIDGQIELTDEPLATHVFVVGDTLNLSGSIDVPEMLTSAGVVTVFDAFASDFMIRKPKRKGKANQQQEEKDRLVSRAEAIQFLQRYGVRPHYEEATFIRNHMFEMFYAFTQFQLLWSRQFLTQFEFTFMPELYPGGIVGFPNYGIRCYIDSVTHTFDYESGFTTQANLSAPAHYGGGEDPGVSQGMVKPLTKAQLDKLTSGKGNNKNKGKSGGE